jgi:hypothetical protein
LPSDGKAILVSAALPLLVSLIVVRGFHPAIGEFARLQSLHPDTYEYLPIGVMKPGQTSTTLRDVLAQRVPPPKVAGMVVEPHFYFPAWSCGRPEPRTQLLMHAPSCMPRIVPTLPEKMGAFISLLACLLLAICSLRRRPSCATEDLAKLRPA